MKYTSRSKRYGRKKVSVRGRVAKRRRLQPGAIVPAGRYGRPLAVAAGYAGAHAVGRAAGAVAREAGAAFRRYNARRDQRADKRGQRVSTVTRATTLGEYNEARTLFVRLQNAAPIPARTLKLGFNKRILRWQRCNTLTGANPPGNIKLSHGAAGTDTDTQCPMFVFCLNQTNNTDDTAGPMRQLRVSDIGQLSFPNAINIGPDGVTATPKWSVEYAAPQPGAEAAAVRYIMSAWYDIRLNCYGATSQPTKYVVEIVSFNDAYCDPLETPSNPQEAADRQALYQSMVQKLMSNPMLPSPHLSNKKYRVHASTSFVLQPTTTIESDPTPSNRIIRMFVKDGSLYDYMYHADGFVGVGADDKLSTTQYVVDGVGVGDYVETPKAKARKWLVIRAMNTTRIAVGALETRVNTPSFDIIVRKGEYLSSR